MNLKPILSHPNMPQSAVSNIQLHFRLDKVKIISVSIKSEFVFSIKTEVDILKVEL